MKKLFISSVFISFILFSCVSPRVVEDLKAKNNQYEKSNSELLTNNENLTTENTELGSQISELNTKIKLLEKDTALVTSSLRKMTKLYNDINDKNDELISKMERINKGNLDEKEKILIEYKKNQEELVRKEEELKNLEQELSKKQSNLSVLKDELNEKAKHINKLESILNQKDSIVNALKNKVSDALLGFENNGLTIKQKNGKVYVSLDEQLLFSSGSWEVAAKGKEALIKLAKVLETNEDINVLIEGHTDNIPYNGAGQIKDNWDLSVLRATAIVKIIINNSKTAPKRLTAAGKAEFVPIDNTDTKEGRKINRRTEIILTPKLDELFKILE